MKNVFLEKAKDLKPVLNTEEHVLLPDKSLKEGDSLILDFGNHYVGYVSLSLDTKGKHCDAPALFCLFFAERPFELEEDDSSYHGWISRSWIQEEQIHVDNFPSVVSLPRRYAFRYLKMTILGLSSSYEVVVKKARLQSVTSAPENIIPVGADKMERRIDEVALYTLKECMQEVFEDGPKRDRRLWLGNLRLEALTNYQTYRHNDLVKRCLYLFCRHRFKRRSHFLFGFLKAESGR